ncbi:Putative AMP-dependent synthetase/ligase domain, phosphopantetheine binding ACP domain, AMP-binding [Colletotrichum destructivum]|uniref:AMP-dependent synthetase/ligase domain, phosphopantetheine binding ACP domain, AMP-binding n=1 Tax=Colletotrichum destructivum TaxID=34406 RepID=A0AAX4I6L6_9PEZI|nr:Putative AMP-dependent synthetase/ligase domain, phosphopantetheine binding ACP domain, AMP-binding [Colletotrichum destructivum]
MSAPQSREAYGKRLIPHVIDDVAKTEPMRECFSLPLSSNPQDGWRGISYGQYATAIDRLAHHIVKTSGVPQPKSFPTVAYIGANDAVYLIFVVAAIKAGYKALFVSPRNSEEAQLNLFNLTDCDILYHDATFQEPVKPWLSKRSSMRANLLAPLDFWLAEDSAVEPFLYLRGADEAEWEPFVVLHTSGSTGLPKPIVVRNGLIMLNDKLHLLPSWKGTESAVRGLARSKRNLTPMPFSHASGLYTFFGFHVYWGTPVTFAITNRPFTADFILEQLAHAPDDVDSISLPPSVLEELSATENGCEVLSKLKFVVFGGGNLSDATGQKLLDRGVVIQNSFGSTECGMLPYYWQANPDAWQWLLIHSDVLGAEWRPVAGEDDVFELVIVRKDPASSIQGVFYTYPDLDEWSSKDLFKKHPTLPDHWKYHGRCDDLIVFSNGEKLNPVTVENALNGHPKVRAAIVVGTMRLQPALLVEPVQYPSSPEEAEDLLEELWPLVAKTNNETAAHARISRQLILLTKADKPFPRLAKDTVHRVPSIKLYEPEVDRLFREAEAGWKDARCNLDLTSEETLLQSMCRLFQTLTYAATIEPDTDFFTAGIDSLQVVNACRLLRGALQVKSDKIDLKGIAPRLIYAKPSPRNLAKEFWGQHVGSLKPVDADVEASRAMSDLLAKYTQNLPYNNQPGSGRSPARDSQQVVILSGSTGRLGAYLLDLLVANPAVHRVVCLNRARDGRTRQLRLNADRGLQTDLAKVEFLQADFARPDLGLGAETYARLLADADRIIHTQWPVNFNLTLESFEPHIRGVRHLIDFCLQASRNVHLVFVSTVLAATDWDGSETASPSVVPAGEYAQGKLVADLTVETATKRSGVSAAVVRVGQIAGPEDAAGVWNPDEWLPRLVASSVKTLGALPRDLGVMSTVNWVTSQGAARLILEVAGVAAGSRAPDTCNLYYYSVNPRPRHFSELSEAIKEFYGSRIQSLVSWEDWVGALERSDREGNDAARNPALQLLDFFKGTPGEAAMKEVRFHFSMEKTLEASPSMREMQPVTRELMVQWCRQWAF